MLAFQGYYARRVDLNHIFYNLFIFKYKSLLALPNPPLGFYLNPLVQVALNRDVISLLQTDIHVSPSGRTSFLTVDNFSHCLTFRNFSFFHILNISSSGELKQTLISRGLPYDLCNLHVQAFLLNYKDTFQVQLWLEKYLVESNPSVINYLFYLDAGGNVRLFLNFGGDNEAPNLNQLGCKAWELYSESIGSAFFLEFLACNLFEDEHGHPYQMIHYAGNWINFVKAFANKADLVRFNSVQSEYPLFFIPNDFKCNFHLFIEIELPNDYDLDLDKVKFWSEKFGSISSFWFKMHARYFSKFLTVAKLNKTTRRLWIDFYMNVSEHFDDDVAKAFEKEFINILLLFSNNIRWPRGWKKLNDNLNSLILSSSKLPLNTSKAKNEALLVHFEVWNNSDSNLFMHEAYLPEKVRVEKINYLISDRKTVKLLDFNPNIRNSFCVSPNFNYLVHDLHYLDVCSKAACREPEPDIFNVEASFAMLDLPLPSFDTEPFPINA